MTQDIDERLKSVVFIFIGVIAMIVLGNAWLHHKMREITPNSSPQVVRPNQDAGSAQDNGKVSRQPRSGGQKITRKDRLSPGRDYTESVFLRGNEEIGRQKIAGDAIVEAEGEIPDGKIRFTNETTSAYGIEYYLDGQKDGDSITYSANGQLQAEASYRRGKLLWKKEYYSDGGIRLEADYRDARPFLRDAKEAGRGRVYFRDGTVKYEWHFTKSDPVAFRKSYNQKGELTAALYFDENGERIERGNLSIIP